MATLANLIVEITAKDNKLRRGLNSSLKAVKSFSSKGRKALGFMFDKASNGISRVSSGFNRAGLSVARFAKRSIVSLGGMLKKLTLVSLALAPILAVSFARSTREISAWSKTLGTSVETLQVWSLAAKGVGIQGDKVADIFKDLSDKLGDALLTGGGEAANIFKDLGLDINTFARLKPEVALQKIADATQHLSKQKRIFIFEALASDSSRLLPLLDKGGIAIRKMGQEMKDLGTIVSGPQAQASSNFADQFDKLSGVVVAIGSKITAGLSVPLEAATKAVVAFIKQAGGIDNVAAKVFEGMGLGVIKLIEGWFALSSALTSLSTSFQVFGIKAAMTYDTLIQKAKQLKELVFGKDKEVKPQASLERTKELVAGGLSPKAAFDQAEAESKAAVAASKALVVKDKMISFQDRQIESIKLINKIEGEAASKRASQERSLLALRKKSLELLEKGSKLITSRPGSTAGKDSKSGTGFIRDEETGRTIRIGANNNGTSQSGPSGTGFIRDEETGRTKRINTASPTSSNRGFIRDESTGKSVNFEANKRGNPVVINVTLTGNIADIATGVLATSEAKDKMTEVSTKVMKGVSRQVAR